MARTNYFLILGVAETADASAIDRAFAELSEKLKPAKFSGTAVKQAEQLLARLAEAHRALQNPNFKESHAQAVKDGKDPYSPEKLKPLIGHVCVAAGFISYEDLMEAVKKQGDIDLPLGQILQERRLITQTELEGMLMGQKLYEAPPRPLQDKIKRLLMTGLITLDMVKIAVIDQRTKMEDLDELICRRGWVDKTILDVLA